jgi:hypothetical protein
MKDYYEQCTPQMVLERRQQYTVGFYSKATHANIWHQLKVRVSKTAGRAGSYPDLQTRSAQCTCRALFDESAFIIQRLRKVLQPVWAKARIAERNLKKFDALWLAQPLRKSYQKFVSCSLRHVSLSKCAYHLRVGGSAFNELDTR